MNTPKHDVNNSLDEAIANRIMDAMIVKGRTLKSLTEDTGIKYSTLRRSLHQNRPDRRGFTIREFLQIAVALEVEPSKLFPDTIAGRSAV